MPEPKSPKYEYITLTAETAAKHKCMRCTHEGRQYFMVIEKVTPEYCWGLNIDTYQTRNYTYDQIPEGMVFEAVFYGDIEKFVRDHLQSLNNEVAMATQKRDIYLQVMNSTLLRIALT
ncbi:MAG: hypothetical protein EON60_11170 [Alphaproteobacteria bacterium]|nr:MAG: hypothetical protein EON60_11170 [Alphaproteobacteria bacterium]